MKAERFLKTLLFLGFLFAACLVCAQQNAPLFLSGNWEYLAFDLPDDGHSIFPDADEAWSPLDHPKHKNPKCTTDVWFRIKMPDWQGDDPAIFISVVKQIIEVYLDSALIYCYGDFTSKQLIAYSGLKGFCRFCGSANCFRGANSIGIAHFTTHFFSSTHRSLHRQYYPICRFIRFCIAGRQYC
jgi:hypothetical protein